jgi:hypothetical protein
MRGMRNEVFQRCVIRAKAGIQSLGACGPTWMRFRGHGAGLSEHPPFERVGRPGSPTLDSIRLGKDPRGVAKTSSRSRNGLVIIQYLY